MARILVIATGGVRAPSALEIVEKFVADGHEVRLLATGHALRFLLIPILTRLGLLRLFLRHFRPQARETLAYFTYRWMGVPHVDEGKWCDLAVVVPASSNSLGKLVAGLADNYPVLVTRGIPRSKRVVVVPSMNPEMWLDPFLQRNIDELNATIKYRVLCPSPGEMASGDFGIGAQVPMDTIINESYRALGLLDPWSGDTIEFGDRAPSDHVTSDTSPTTLLLVDEDDEFREKLSSEIERVIKLVHVISLGTLTEAKTWLQKNAAGLILTSLEFKTGESGRELVEMVRSNPLLDGCPVVVTSLRSRAEAGAEALAKKDVHFLPKPINLPFVVGMIAGLIGASTVARQGTPMTLAAGEVLFRKGDRGDEIYHLLSGRLEVSIEQDTGRIKRHEITEGEIIGELAFVTGERRSATVAAISECKLLRIDTADFADYLARQPAWLGRILKTLVDRVRRADLD